LDIAKAQLARPATRSLRHGWSDSQLPVDLAPPKAPQRPSAHRFGARNPSLTWVELSGLEPLTSCMPSGGSTSTRVHLCRSLSSCVPARPPLSVCVAVLPCCTAATPPGATSRAPEGSPDQRQPCIPDYRCALRRASGQRAPEALATLPRTLPHSQPRTVARLATTPGAPRVAQQRPLLAE
jgi:hypothetical protein